MLEINVSFPTLLPDGLPPSTVAVQCTKVCTQVYTTYNKLEASMTVVDNTVQTVCGSTERLPVRRFHCNYMQMFYCF